MSLPALIAEAILSARADAIVAADSDGIIRFWNPGAERIFGYSSDEALGRSLDLIVPERLRQRHWDGYRRVMETGRSRYGESDLLSVPALRKDGATISVEFTIVPLRENGGLLAIAAIMRDVTARFAETRALKRRLAEIAKPPGAAGSTSPKEIRRRRGVGSNVEEDLGAQSDRHARCAHGRH